MSPSIIVVLTRCSLISNVQCTSRRGQTLYASVMIVIPLIPIMALVIQNIIILRDVIERKENLLVADRSVLKSDETARLIAALQRERTASLMQVSVVTNRTRRSIFSSDFESLNSLNNL